jgi:hypothetical protein
LCACGSLVLLILPGACDLSPPSATKQKTKTQILFLSGVALTIGPRSTLRFFTRRRNARGSAFFGAGLVLVLAGWAVVGMAVEAYGFWLLFAGFFPTVLGFLRRAPVLGPVLDAPVLKTVRRERERAFSFSLGLSSVWGKTFTRPLPLPFPLPTQHQVINKIAPAQSLPV